MSRSVIIAALLAAVGIMLANFPAAAGSNGYSQQGAEHPKSNYYRGGGAKVKGYTRRRGGYSYTYEDSINTYGDSRGHYGSANSFRDPMIDKQTEAGPFDHGFFFDSGIAPNGGSSPYMN